MRVQLVDQSARCVFCGYRLAGLPLDGACPECGRLIRDSAFDRTRTHRALVFLPIALVSAFVFAAEFTLVYFRGHLHDKAVVELAYAIVIYASMAAIVSGFLAWPLYYWALKERRLGTTIPFVTFAVIASIVAVGLSQSWGHLTAWPVSYLVLAAALLVCKYGNVPFFLHRRFSFAPAGEPSRWNWAIAVFFGLLLYELSVLALGRFSRMIAPSVFDYAGVENGRLWLQVGWTVICGGVALSLGMLVARTAKTSKASLVAGFAIGMFATTFGVSYALSGVPGPARLLADIVACICGAAGVGLYALQGTSSRVV